MNLFGKKKKPVVNPNSAIHQLQETIDTLDKREQHLTKQMTDLRKQAANVLKKKNKKRALYLMRRAKICEKQIDNVCSMKLNLEVQISTLTQAVTNTDVYKAISSGRDALKGLETKVNPDTIADVIDDIDENMANVEEIAEIMGRPIGNVEDDDELLAELEEDELEQEIVQPVKNEEVKLEFPEVPRKSIKGENHKTEEEELKELEDLMN